tara:strand:- start:12304 stop:12525 length:222 start_codon:yes stop_codon:yes gene_type:complete
MTNQLLEKLRSALVSSHWLLCLLTDDTDEAEMQRQLIAQSDEKTFKSLARLRRQTFDAIHSIPDEDFEPTENN